MDANEQNTRREMLDRAITNLSEANSQMLRARDCLLRNPEQHKAELDLIVEVSHKILKLEKNLRIKWRKIQG